MISLFFTEKRKKRQAPWAMSSSCASKGPARPEAGRRERLPLRLYDIADSACRFLGFRAETGLSSSG